MTKILFLYFLIIFVFFVAGCNSDEANIYSEAVKAAKSNQRDFAFMKYRAILKDYPDSKFRQQALFAEGEYYFMVSNHKDSALVFNRFISSYPDSDARIFALVYLLKISERKKEQLIVSEIKKKIINFERVSFIFRNSKEYIFQSPLGRSHKVIIQINKMSFYLEGELFAEITY